MRVAEALDLGSSSDRVVPRDGLDLSQVVDSVAVRAGGRARALTSSRASGVP